MAANGHTDMESILHLHLLFLCGIYVSAASNESLAEWHQYKRALMVIIFGMYPWRAMAKRCHILHQQMLQQPPSSRVHLGLLTLPT
jgi:hypothetical protein